MKHNNSISFRIHFRLYKRVKFNDEAGEDYSLSAVKDIKGITPSFMFSTYCQYNYYSRRVPLDTGQYKGQVLDRAVQPEGRGELQASHRQRGVVQKPHR